MEYIISPRIKYRSEPFGEIAESYTTGLIVFSEGDSKRVIEEVGAEELLGSGDVIFKDLKRRQKIRIQTPFISTEDTEAIVKKLTTRECLCTNPKCMKCLLANCTDDDCKIHTKDNKRKTRQRVYYPRIKRILESRIRK